MGKHKLFNDPIYGLINFKSDLIYDIIDHSSFQRLRRIAQMGMTHYVYPGATHSRFQHAIGAVYLMQTTIDVLKDKGVDISEYESESMCAAMLLHDIGHGPISHSLEFLIIDVHHEDISLHLMELLNKEMNGRLDLAIDIYKKKCDRAFMHQLVSGQLDLDRMDYITRDSYYTGVAEGVIGYKRIVSMLNVVDDQLVVEEKALFSVQKFLLSREIMYKQVYLHKTSISAEQMLRTFYKRLKFLQAEKSLYDNNIYISKPIQYFLEKDSNDFDEETAKQYLAIDDHDIYNIMKTSLGHPDYILRDYAQRLLGRNLFKAFISGEEFAGDFVSEIRQKVKESQKINKDLIEWYILQGRESIITYTQNKGEINVLMKTGEVQKLSSFLSKFTFLTLIDTYFLCYPS